MDTPAEKTRATAEREPAVAGRRFGGRWSLGRWMLVLVGLNLLWRTVRYLLVFPMWGDEAFVAVNFFHHGFADMLQPLDHFQIVPVGFMWAVLAVSKVLGTGEMALRFFPWVCGLAGMTMFAILARRMLDRRSALLAIAIFAASYYPVRHSVEVKPYSFDLLLAIVMLMLAWRVWRRPSASMRWIALGLAGVAVVWCSYPVVFVAGGALAVLSIAVWRAREPVVVVLWLLSGAALCSSFALMYLVVGRAQAEEGAVLFESHHWVDNFPPVGEPWKLPWWLLVTHTGNLLAYPFGGRNFGSMLTFLLVIAGCIALWKEKRRGLLLLLLSPFPLMFIAGAIQKYPYGGSARIAQHLAPAVCLLAGAGLLGVFRALWPPRKVVEATRVVPIVMAVIIVGATIADVVKPYKRRADAECRHVVNDLASRLRSSDRLVVFLSLGPHPLAPNLSKLGGSAARLRYNLLQDVPVEIEWTPEVSDILNDIDTGRIGGDLWVLEYHDNDVAFPAESFERWLAPLLDRLGPPRIEIFDLHHRAEEIRIHHFELRN